MWLRFWPRCVGLSNWKLLQLFTQLADRSLCSLLIDLHVFSGIQKAEAGAFQIQGQLEHLTEKWSEKWAGYR